MYLTGVNNIQYNNYTTVGAVKATVENNSHAVSASRVSNPQSVYFTSASASLRTQLSSADEKNKYNELLKTVSKDTKKQLNILLKNGVLLNSASNDNSTTLDNLYKIATTPRAQGLSNNDILAQTVAILADPHVITQQFGNIPTQYKSQVAMLNQSAPGEENVEHSGTCVASSI